MRFIVTGCSHRCMCSGSPPGVGWTSKSFCIWTVLCRRHFSGGLLPRLLASFVDYDC